MKIIKLEEVVEKTSVNRNSIYEMIKRKEFPAQIKLNSVSSGWILSEIDTWMLKKLLNETRLIEE